MAQNATASIAQTDTEDEQLPRWIKCKDVVGLHRPVAIVDAEQFEFEEKTSAKYTVKMPDGELRALTMAWSDQRARTVGRIIREIDNGADWVEATLIQLPGRDGKSGYLLWDPLETDRTSDFKRAILADNAARRAGTPRDPMQSPEHKSWERDQAAAVAVGDDPGPSDEDAPNDDDISF
jgi:hypothetical protein